MKRDKKGTPEEIGVSDCKTDTGENARVRGGFISKFRGERAKI